MRDVIIVGGSFAGHAAALMLGRARRQVLMLDAGAPRNRFADASHGFLGQDGRAPGEIMQIAREQLAAYETVEQRAGLAVRAVAEEAGFRLVMADGTEEVARRLVLATGQRDVLPDLPGLAERWGKTVLHCPYCHGYELNQGPIGVLAAGEMSMHHALMLPDWGPTTLFLQGAFVPSAEQQAALAARGVVVEPVPVAALEGDGASVRLADGRRVALAGLFIAARTELASDLAVQLGCAMAEGPLGVFVSVDERKMSSVRGVFAAGDLSAPMANASLAVAAGMMAGAGTHGSLISG